MALLTDSSTNNFQLSAFGNTALNTTTFKYGGGSAYFDGNGDYIRGNQLFNYSSNFTIEGWVYRTGSGSLGTIFEAGDIQSGQGGVHFYIDSNGTFVLNDGFTPDFQGGTATLNQWVHFAIVRNNNVNTLYINGTAVGSGNQTYPVTNNIFTIGGAPNYGFYFQGYIDDFRITSGIARYTSNFTPPAQQLPDPSDPHGDKVSLLLHMDGADGSTTFTDSSSNNFTLTAFGNAQIDTSIKKFGSGAALFDGNGDYIVLEDNEDLSFNTGFNTYPSIPFTIEAWVYPLSLSPTTGSVVISKDTNGSNFSWALVLYSNKLGCYTHNINSDWQFEAAATVLTNTWQHVALTMDGFTQRLFLNGQLLGSKNAPITNASSKISIGCYSWNNPGGFFNGYIDELRVTKGVARYTSNFVPQTAPFANPVSIPYD